MKLFVNGRREVFKTLEDTFSPADKIIWLHAASLGEYEQGLPVLEDLKKKYPSHKILITFFSPSGYEIKKDNKLADCTVYLPIDTPQHARRFINLINVTLVIFVKYEVWPNYLSELDRQSIQTILISGNFRPDQIYFKSFGRFMKTALQHFDHLFVQNEPSKKLLETHGLHNVSISGDTRFDRVVQQLSKDNHLSFVEEFKNEQLCLVCGSTWPADLSLLTDYFNQAPESLKIIIAPHQINYKDIADFRKKVDCPSVLYSEKEQYQLKDYPIMIIDTVGLLTKIYAYADMAYVGGAAGQTGLHNILEPAAFGIPIIIGKNHKKFPEAAQLEQQKGLLSVGNAKQCASALNSLVSSPQYRKKTGVQAADYIQHNKGATQIILDYLNS